MSATARVLGQERIRARPTYEGLFGLLLVGLLLLSTLDETALAPVGRGLLLGCFGLLTVINVGAAFGVYVAAALLFSMMHFQGQGSWVQRPDNFALLFLAFYLIGGRCFSRSAGVFGWTAVAIALLLATTFIHLILLVGVDAYWLTWCARMFLIPLGSFVLLRRAALSPRELRALLLIIAALGVYLAAVSMLEVLDWYSLVIPPWLADPNFNPAFEADRVGGLAMQPEWNALDISLALWVLLLHLGQKGTRVRAGWLAAAGLCLLAVYFTYTRGAWLGLLMGGLPLFWQQSAVRGVTFRRRVLFLAGILAFASFVLFFPSRVLQGRMADSNTVYFRFGIWLAGLRMVVEHPFFGVGFGQFALHLDSFVRDFAWLPANAAAPRGGTIAHNTILSVAAELGLVGLTLYGLTIWRVYKSARAAAAEAWGQRGSVWVAGFTLVYHTNVQFITAHWLTSNLLYFGVMGAIAGTRGVQARAPGAALAYRPGVGSANP